APVLLCDRHTTDSPGKSQPGSSARQRQVAWPARPDHLVAHPEVPLGPFTAPPGRPGHLEPGLPLRGHIPHRVHPAPAAGDPERVDDPRPPGPADLVPATGRL